MCFGFPERPRFKIFTNAFFVFKVLYVQLFDLVSNYLYKNRMLFVLRWPGIRILKFAGPPLHPELSLCLIDKKKILSYPNSWQHYEIQSIHQTEQPSQVYKNEYWGFSSSR